MANGMYDKGRQRFGNAEINWAGSSPHPIKLVLLDMTKYTPNLASDEFLGDIPADARQFLSPDFAGKTNVGGVLGAADVVCPNVPVGPDIGAVAIYRNVGGDPSASPLIAFIDTVSSGLPASPNGENITIRWDEGDNKIFKL